MAGYPTSIEKIRRLEFPQLEGKTYLDHAGSQLPTRSLIQAVADDITSNIYGNPHSENLPATVTGRRVDEARLKTLRFFNADPEDYSLIFVANTTAAIKLVAESFRDYITQVAHDDTQRHGSWSNRMPSISRRASRSSGRDFRYLYHKDCHTSLVGIRELTSQHHCFSSDDEVESWIDAPGNGRQPLTLFAFPGQSNMTGRRLPVDWPMRIKNSSTINNTYTLLDAAALATTKELQISTWKPDFVAVSFYKIFGFPDLGALLVRKSTAAHIMNARRYFGGGTVEMVITLDDQWHAKKSQILHNAHEDGTLPFHNIIALSHALDNIEQVYGGIKSISTFTQSLTRELYVQLVALRHYNNSPVVRIYKDEPTEFGNPHLQGATVTFSVLRSTGEAIGFKDVERAADQQHIYLRSGALCNPGGIASYLGWSGENLRQAYEAGHRCSNPKESVEGRITGVVRVSLGACTSREDIAQLVRFIRSTYVETVSRLEVPPSDGDVIHSSSRDTGRHPPLVIARMGGSDENIIATSPASDEAPKLVGSGEVNTNHASPAPLRDMTWAGDQGSKSRGSRLRHIMDKIWRRG